MRASRRRAFPNTPLWTQDGDPVGFYDDVIRGRTVLISFLYTRCRGACPMQTANLVRVQRGLGERAGRDIFIVSLTLDPERDTPATLAAYAKAHHVGPGWTFLTGRPADVELLRRRLGFTDPDPRRDRDRSQHLGIFVYGNEPLDRWAACPALTSPDSIVRTLTWFDRANARARP